jgi:hypothetical protein
MNHELVRLALLALIGAALGALSMLPRHAHGETTVRDAHEVPPFARSRTEIIHRDADCTFP